MRRRDVSVTLPWMGAGTEFVLRAVGALPDDALAAPSRLPGWSRAHVVAHLARNAEALTRLATWARTGVESRMYANREQRAADIEDMAQASVDTLRAELTSTAGVLDAAFAALDEQAWQAPVRTAADRPIPASEVPWMRVREVWLHAVDLDAGVEVADLPADVVNSLLDDVVENLSAQDGCPAARLVPTDRDRGWSLGPDGGAEARSPETRSPEASPEVRGPEVRGTAADLLGWLTGRGSGERLRADGPLPTPPRWL